MGRRMIVKTIDEEILDLKTEIVERKKLKN